MHQKVLGKPISPKADCIELLIALPFSGKIHMKLKTRLYKSITKTLPQWVKFFSRLKITSVIYSNLRPTSLISLFPSHAQN